MSRLVSGEPFNPWHGACGFFPQDVLGRQQELPVAAGTLQMVTDGQKRLYERLVQFAGTNGRCFPSQSTLASELGKSERQIRKDLVKLEQFRLIRHLWRQGRRSNTYEFLCTESLMSGTAVPVKVRRPSSLSGTRVPLSATPSVRLPSLTGI
jgi:hypothetical protein